MCVFLPSIRIYNIIDGAFKKKSPQISKKSKLFASDPIFLAKSEKITPVEAGISFEPSTTMTFASKRWIFQGVYHEVPHNHILDN